MAKVFYKTISGGITKLQKSHSMNSSFWVAFGMLSSQLIRLSSNLVLTRLLLPEYFGIMAIVNSVLAFFTLMTDIGLVPNVINSKRDKEPEFMQTIWSLQVVMAALVSVLVILAAYPVSLFYAEPLLLPILILVAISSFFAGMNSVALLLERKYIRLKKLVLFQLVSQLLGTIVIIILAYYTKSIWSLVIGVMVTKLIMLTMSYMFFKPNYSKFRFERTTVSEVFNFGKWIFLSSIFSYINSHSRPVILAVWLSMVQVGIYTVAASLAAVVEAIVNKLANMILMPKYRQLILGENYGGIVAVRKKMIMFFLPPTILIAISGEYIVRILYDDRYQWAGGVLQILALGRIATLLSSTARPLLLSMGNPKAHMGTQAMNTFISLPLLLLTGSFTSVNGLVIVIALLPFIDYIIVRRQINRHKISLFKVDKWLVLVAIMVIFSSWYALDSSALKLLKSFLLTLTVNLDFNSHDLLQNIYGEFFDESN